MGVDMSMGVDLGMDMGTGTGMGVDMSMGVDVDARRRQRAGGEECCSTNPPIQLLSPQPNFRLHPLSRPVRDTRFTLRKHEPNRYTFVCSTSE